MINYKEEILRLKKEKNAVILAHYYQEPEIQQIADFVGDSLGLAQQAAKTEADIIVFAGVLFMAETAKILSPNKKVLLPDLAAGCSLSDSCQPEAFKAFKEKHPDHIVLMYVNCSAEIKGMSDIICTSSNARKIVESLPKDQKIIFAPDRNLGKYLIGITGRDMVLWDGACMVHEAFSYDKLVDLMTKHPNAKLIAHPESQTPVLKLANFIGSTAAMLNYVKTDSCQEFLVATEAGILHKMKEAAPNKMLVPVPVNENNACACSICPYMKLNTMEKLYDCLVNETPQISLSDEVIAAAVKPLDRMMELS